MCPPWCRCRRIIDPLIVGVSRIVGAVRTYNRSILSPTLRIDILCIPSVPYGKEAHSLAPSFLRPFIAIDIFLLIVPLCGFRSPITLPVEDEAPHTLHSTIGLRFFSHRRTHCWRSIVIENIYYIQILFIIMILIENLM